MTAAIAGLLQRLDAEVRLAKPAPAPSADVPPSKGLSVSDVIGRWRAWGPVERLPTGWSTLDTAMRGGLTFGKVTFVLGAPNAWKTGTFACWGNRWVAAGVGVAFHGVDEDPDDFFMRIAQQHGATMLECERRDPAFLSALEVRLADLPIRFYDLTWSIEDAAADFAAWLDARGITRGAYIADSAQTVRSRAAAKADSPKGVVDANVYAFRLLASRYRWVVASTSEMNRGGYRSEDASERYNDMAAGKESGGIEYGASTQLVLRSVKGESSLVQVHAPKIKRGTDDADGLKFFLRLDRQTHSITECGAPDQPHQEQTRESAKVALSARQVVADSKIVARVVRTTPGIGERDLRAELKRLGHGWGVTRLDAAKKHLGHRLQNRGAHARDVQWFFVDTSTAQEEQDAAAQ